MEEGGYSDLGKLCTDWIIRGEVVSREPRPWTPPASSFPTACSACLVRACLSTGVICLILSAFATKLLS
jgi:hypothetical protein